MSLPDRYAGRPVLPSMSVGQSDVGQPEIREVGLRRPASAAGSPVLGAVHATPTRELPDG
jgi:hypothetical protein